MPVIGKLNESEHNGYHQICGELHSLELDLTFRLQSLPARDNENAPDYTALTKNAAGRDVPIGSAWRKVAKRGPHAGDQFLSLTFDDPSFRTPLNLAAFRNGQPGQWDIVWRRRQDHQSAEAPSKAENP